MGIGSLIVGLGMVLVSLMVISRPWRVQTSADGAAENSRLRGSAARDARDRAPAQQSLMARRDAIYAALADLDFDSSIGKLNEEDHALVRSQLMSQAVAVLQEMDANEAGIESRVEALVSERRRRGVPKGTGDRSGAFLGLTNVYCTGCGSALKPEDQFCGRCGRAVTDRCPQCDAAIHSEGSFCVRCGSAIADAHGAASAAAAV